MSNIEKKEVSKPVQDLINYFGGQKEAAKALGLTQGTITGWLRKKHGVSPVNATKVEVATKRYIKASDLCPALLEIEEMQLTANQNDQNQG